jgi:hypothetical protein
VWVESGRVIPRKVWTGSYNFTRNGGRSLENAVLLTDELAFTPTSWSGASWWAFPNRWIERRITCNPTCESGPDGYSMKRDRSAISG